MSRLEVDMARVVGRWAASGNRRLGADGVDLLNRWALKTHIVLAALEGGMRDFGKEGLPSGVVPPATHARLLYEGSPNALGGVTVGIARTADRTYNYGFGHPTVVPQGPDYVNCNSATTSCVNLGDLQVWTVLPVFASATVKLPARVRKPMSESRFARLVTMPRGEPPLEAVLVDNGPHSVVELFGEVYEQLRDEGASYGGDTAPKNV